MGIFSNIIKILTGRDDNSKDKRLLERILYLARFKQDKQKELSDLQSKRYDNSWYQVTPKNTDIKYNSVFSAKKIGPAKTMKDLFEKRRKEEEERIRQLQNTIAENFDKVTFYIIKEKVQEAEELLFQNVPLLKQLRDDSFDVSFESLQERIAELKALLIQREIERKEKEEKERIEREEREKERLRVEQEKKEQERAERVRKAKAYEEKLLREETERAEEISRLTSIVTITKENAQAYLSHLKLNGVQCFYHFTDEANLKSIRRLGGLFSWYYCGNNNITIPNPGGDFQSRGLDSNLGLEDYVRLSFCDDHPMAFRKKQEGASLVLLQISIEVATFKDTMFSNINAATQDRTRNKFGKDLKDLQRVNISATKRHFVSRDEGDIFFEHQAECMVKTFIPLKYIININNPAKIR